MKKSNLLNPFKFLLCYFISGHDWRDAGDWFICWRCNHPVKLPSR